jgi:DNA-3-methyladenine glycosylase I
VRSPSKKPQKVQSTQPKTARHIIPPSSAKSPRKEPQKVQSTQPHTARHIIPPSPAKSPKKAHSTQPQTAGHDHVYAAYINQNPLYADYLLNEWGFEKRSEEELFEHLSLSGAQCGMSWWVILGRREAYRQAFHGFDIDKVASMTIKDVEKLLCKKSEDRTELVVQNRGKVESVIHNAKLIQKLKASGTITSLSEYLWSFVDDKPILNRLQTKSDMPTMTEESEHMSNELKKNGFKYVGPTTMYAMMQSCGLVMDHLVGSKHLADVEKRLKKRGGGYQIR